MPIRSMTGFAQVRGEARPQDEGAAAMAFTLAMKSVNHRFLDLHMRMPSESDALEMKLRRLLKEKVNRGHVEVTLSLERSGAAGFALNREVVGGYLQVFRAAAKEFAVASEPDLNAVMKLPGALAAASAPDGDGGLNDAVLASAREAISRLNAMRDEEGRGIEHELRERMKHLQHAIQELDKLRAGISRAYLEKVQSRLQELIGAQADPDRLLQEAALMAERSDVQEEIVRMHTHVEHFL